MKNKKLRLNTLLFIVLGLFVLVGCSKKDSIDYSNSNNWAFYVEAPEHEVDIFFIAPTSGFDESFNMKMDDEAYKAAFSGAIEMEKGIYDTNADFYAPFYRQVSLECYSLPVKEQEQYLSIAYKDVENAFTYYIQNVNNGRPYIIAGFSQGADMTERLLKNCRLIDGRLIAAYAIGWHFNEKDIKGYSNIKMATCEDDLGVVITFASVSENYDDKNNLIVPTSTLSINPLNWKTDGTVATKEENIGACFTNYSGVILNEIPNLCGAYIDSETGVLRVTDVTPKQYPAGLSFLEEGNYHLYDYQFFYRNLQENVKLRISKYLQQ